MEDNSSLPDFRKIELDVLKHWADINAFKTCLEQSKNKPKYTFYDGPPFATGLPHYGHILAGTIKDVVTRYAHQNGYHVDRRFGWDCHGVPVEFIIDKEYNISGPSDVEKMGIDKYNVACRSIVSKYSSEWEQSVTRIGRWIDFQNDYKTMYPWFMESVWNVFKCIYEKGLVYRGVKVMPFSTGCATPFSNFEAKLNFKEVSDPVVVVTFPLVNEPDVEFLAWTTTPWTLPSNLALCVNADMKYVKVEHEKSGKKYILLESLIKSVFRKDTVKILETFIGKSLEGIEYVELFDYFKEERSKQGAFRVLCDGYVTSESGTGIVHQSPYFGEDDYRVCLSYGVIDKSSRVICPVDSVGKFTEEVTDFKGMYVKDADEHIIKHIKSKGRLLSSGKEMHSYPFCYRSETPLLYKAVRSWFIEVESIRDKLIASNDATYWVPEFVKTNRFGNWLKDARDWAFSRNRYWGTPIPLWISDDGEEVVCVGSRKELADLSGVEVSDLHREFIDHIIIPSKTGRGVLRRIPEVFDCWFESGSMPYAQVHFPFKTNYEQFKNIFPADFIAEGLDQTRGWFYTLTVIGTILFGQSPFKNLVVNGIVLAEDGQKMSKSKKNYPDPMLIIDNHGADALRMYLISSPVVRAQNLRFKESGVQELKRDVFGPWYNANKFLLNSSLSPFERKLCNGQLVKFQANQVPKSDNILDKWIISETQSLILFVKTQMKLYHLDNVIPRLLKFIDQLTNWYVKMNRRRLQGESGAIIDDKDWFNAIHTLHYVSYQITLLMTPFVPFITEYFYGKLRVRLDYQNVRLDLKVGVDENGTPESVHYLMMPDYDEQLIDSEIEIIFGVLESVVETGRKIRDREKLPLKWPLSEVVILSRNLDKIQKSMHYVEQYICEGISVKKVVLSHDLAHYGVQLKAVLNHKELGIRLKKDYPKVLEASKKLTNDELEQFQVTGTIELLGYQLNHDDLEVVASSDDSSHQDYSLMVSNDGLIVALNIKRTTDLINEGIAREIRSRIQRRRKELQLVKEDPVCIYWWSQCPNVYDIIRDYHDTIDSVVQEPIIYRDINDKTELLTCSLLTDTNGCDVDVRIEDKDEIVKLWFCHDHTRVTKVNRQCSKNSTGVNKDNQQCTKNRTVVNFGDVKPLKNGIVIIDQENGKSCHFDINQLKHVDDVKRLARLEFGWTEYSSNQFELIDLNEGLQFPRQLKDAVGRVYYIN